VWNEFLPGIVSVGISVCVFLYAWIADIRRIQRLDTPEAAEFNPEIESVGVELSLARDVG
jgi:hypothetical protein